MRSKLIQRRIKTFLYIIFCLFTVKMGNKSETGTVKQERVNFQFSHPRFKNAGFQKDLSRETIVTRIPVNNQKQYDDWVEKLKNSPGASQEGALNPVKHEFEKGGLCGSSGNVTAQYENYPFTLTEEIKNRQEAKHRVFEENQLWYLIYTFADVGSKFHNRGGKVGDIRPENVFINEDGQLKVATKHSWPQEMDNYQKAFCEKEKTYLAPEEAKDLQIGRSQTVADTDLAESFSAGLTVLDTALLENSENIYTKNGNIDFETLQGKKQNLKNDVCYGDLLKHTILSMLQNNPENRIKLNELNDWLEPYSSDIINLQPFHAKILNPKIEKTAKQNPINRRFEQSKREIYPIKPSHESKVLDGFPQKSEVVLKSNPISSNEGNEVRKLQSGAPQNIYKNQPPIIHQSQPPLPVQRQTVPVSYNQPSPHNTAIFNPAHRASQTNNAQQNIIPEPIRQAPHQPINVEQRQPLRQSAQKNPVFREQSRFIDPRSFQTSEPRKISDPIYTDLRQTEPRKYYDPMRPSIIENQRQNIVEIPRSTLNEPPRMVEAHPQSTEVRKIDPLIQVPEYKPAYEKTNPIISQTVNVEPPQTPYCIYPIEPPKNYFNQMSRQAISNEGNKYAQPRISENGYGESLNYKPHQQVELTHQVKQVRQINQSMDQKPKINESENKESKFDDRPKIFQYQNTDQRPKIFQAENNEDRQKKNSYESNESQSSPLNRLQDRIYEIEGVQPNYHYSETANQHQNEDKKKQSVYRKFTESILPDANNQTTVTKTVQSQDYVDPEGTHVVKTETITRTERTEKINSSDSKPEIREESIKSSFNNRGKSSLSLIQEKIANSRRMYPSQ